MSFIASLFKAETKRGLYVCSITSNLDGTTLPTSYPPHLPFFWSSWYLPFWRVLWDTPSIFWICLLFPWVLLTCSSVSSSPCTPEIRSKGLEVEVKVTQSCPNLWDPMDCPWNSPGQNTGVGSLFLLQGIFSTQGSNPGLPHCRQVLYQLSHKENPRILE